MLLVHQLADYLFDGVDSVKLAVTLLFGNSVEEEFPSRVGNSEIEALKLRHRARFDFFLTERREGDCFDSYQIGK